jgi:membrane protein required for colicin V production
MWIDLVAAVLLVALVISGAARGALASALALLTWVGAYVAAVLLAPAFAPQAAGAFGVPRVLGAALAGAGVFFAAYLGLGLAAALLRWAERRARGGAPRSAADRSLGAFFGALRGVALALLLGVMGYWLQAYQELSGRRPLDGVGGSAVAAASQGVVHEAATVLLDQETPEGRMATRAVSHPAQALGAMQGILDDPRFLILRDDREFWDAVERGETHRATGRVSFQTLTYAPDLRRRFAQAGFVSPAESRDPELFRTAMDDALSQVGPRIRNLRDDPEVRSLADDPDVVELLESGDTLGLLRHPRFRRLVDRVLAS